MKRHSRQELRRLKRWQRRPELDAAARLGAETWKLDALKLVISDELKEAIQKGFMQRALEESLYSRLNDFFKFELEDS